ncbi:hypothetical protein PTSG_05202 [Salpingoeca rosetta]|uniref:ODAD1 central coiled coil region domain-containing protein n=1 Tax=Salpingoeca rosetta (strain ATCC 50818 / BSB-021) TaxID=946362 RepID=F2UAT2_SALR5|nr:uncharacterized protein PTSG_05202 [Salpingoeca rosetta]EGD73498.1 hypothetical protein PTSG_05202 [Salpingoeca rosetta]|eukprot:XP_004993780.1 hypothetical protein PTSG_05202 [Salpingoeca rosetta]
MTRRLREDDDDHGFQDVELSTLQRQFRVAEGYRKAYSEESHNTLRKQEEQIAKLTKDNEFLMSELKLADAAERTEQKVAQTCATMSSVLQKHEDEVAQEKSRNDELGKEIRDMERKLAQKRRNVGGASGVEERKAKVNAQISTMENRLEKMLKKYNATLTENAKLRETIDHLKQERKVFDTMHRRIEKDLGDVKRRTAAVVEQSHKAHEARDEAQNKIAALEEKAAKELQLYNLEIKELSRVLEHDRKLKTFMGVKALPRNLEEVPVSQKRKTKAADSPETMVQTYDEAFRKIKATTGIEDTTKLVDLFIEVEDQNFSLFNLVNELNNEIEKTQEQRTNELLQLQALLDQKEKETWETKEMELREQLEDDLEFDPTKTLGPKPVPGGLLGTGPAQPVPSEAVIPTNIADDIESLTEEEEDLTRPLSHAEMKQKLMATMSRKAKA